MAPVAQPLLGDVIVGSHSPTTEWVFGVVEAIVSRWAPERRCVRVDRFDRVDWLGSEPAVLLANYPSAQIIDAVERDAVRVVYVWEDPDSVLDFMTSTLRLSPVEAIRSQSASAVANLAVGRNRNVLLVTTRSLDDPDESALRIAKHIGLAVSRQDIAAIVPPRARPDRGTPAREAGSRSTVSLPAIRPSTSWRRDQDLVEACELILSPMLAMARGDCTRPVVWPTAVFKFSDTPDGPAPLVAKISGPARNLYYGPYLYLPPARYRVEVLLEFSREIVDIPFIIEVHGSSWLANARINERRAGGYRGYFLLDHWDPTASLEIRLRNESPVATGMLSLIELSFFVTHTAAA
ncbi:MAG: hypothetical protein AB7L90_22110 [Hyphomicrobiaceae bacterium]